jgi:branched-chain amino acid transport system ATP-binding protein
VEEGEFLGVVGPNGAGKTTLLRVICGALPVTAGTVTVLGADAARTPTHRLAMAGLAHVPEDRQVFGRMTVLDNLRMGAYPPRARRAFAENLERVYRIFPVLPSKAGQRASSLSGGQQQMLSIGRAFMSAPRLMLFDEPALGLSPQASAEVLEAIRTINALGVTVVLVEQHVARALASAARAVVLERGAVAMAGRSGELARDPHVIHAYLGLRQAVAVGKVTL